MAFKLRSPLNNKPGEFGSVPVAASSKGYAGYQSMLKDRLRSTAPENRVGGHGGGNKSTGTFPDPQTGEKRYYDKAHQSYSSKTGLVNKSGSFKDGVYSLNKPKPKAKSNLPASQGGSPFNNVASLILNATSNKKSKGLSSLLPSSYNAQGPGGRGIAVSGGPEKPAATPGKGSGVIPNLLPAALNPGNKVMLENPGASTNTTKSNTNKPKNTVKPSSNTTKSSNITTTLSTGSNTNADKSGGYLKDTKNFSLGVDTKLSTGSMPKFERTVTNARSADYDMIRAKGRGKIDRLKTRLDKREGRVANRVEASSMRIKSRQQRSGNRYASKMEARTNTGTNPGKFESQKKLDAFEKAMDSPKATAQKKTKQPGTPGSTLGASTKSSKIQVKKPSATLPKNPGITSGSISSGPSVNVSKSSSASSNLTSSLAPKGQKAKTFAATPVSVNSKTPELRGLGAKNKKQANKFSKKATKTAKRDNKKSTKSLTAIASGNNVKAGSKTNKLTNIAKGNKVESVKNMSSKEYLTKGIKPSYKK